MEKVATTPSVIRQPDYSKHMAGSARRPKRHSMWKHKDSMGHEPATSCVSQIKLEAQRLLDSTTGH